jgi:hypothetical protein
VTLSAWTTSAGAVPAAFAGTIILFKEYIKPLSFTQKKKHVFVVRLFEEDSKLPSEAINYRKANKTQKLVQK